MVLILHSWELLLITDRARENVYWDVKGKIVKILKSSLPESLVLVPIIILLIFFLT